MIFQTTIAKPTSRPHLGSTPCAAKVAAAGLEATKGMIAQHGKAACFQEKTLGLQDAGATVGFLLTDTLRAFVVEAAH